LRSVFTNQILVTGLGVVSGVLSARLLGPTEKGVAAAAVLIAGLVAAMSHLGLPYAVTYNISLAPAPVLGLRQTLAVCTRVLPVNALGIAGLYALAYSVGRHSVLNGLALPVVVASFALCVLTLFHSLIVSVLSGLQDFGARNSVVFLPVLAVVLFVLFHWTSRRPMAAVALVWANALSVGISALYGVAVIAARYRPAFLWHLPATWPKDYLWYGLKFQLALVAQALNYRLDALIVNALVGSTTLGLYSVAVSSAEVLTMIPTAVDYVLYPKVAEARGVAKKRLTVLALGGSLYLVILSGVALGFALPWLIPMLYGTQFSGSLAPALILLPGMVSLTVVKIISHAAAGFGRPEYATYATVLGLAATVPLDFALIPRMGILGAALASTAAYTVAAVAALALYCRVSGSSFTEVVAGIVRQPWTWVRERGWRGAMGWDRPDLVP
jgi:O-antigen/teichoic acid export membrane protein